MTTNDRLNALLKAIEATFGRGESSKWINRDFMDLGFEINKKTKVAISALTLKRIFGKIKTETDYIPQKATIKALEEYANVSYYSQTEQLPETAQNTSQKDTATAIEIKPKPRSFKKRVALISTLATIILILAGYFVVIKPNRRSSSSRGTLKLTRTEGFNPKSVFIEYDAPNSSDSIKLLFDPSFPAIPIEEGSYKTSYIYQYPGLFNIKMVKKGQVISNCIPILIETKGWQCLGSYYEQKYDDRYFPIIVKRNTEKGYFHTTSDDLQAAGMDTTKIAVIRLANFYSTKVNNDNFKLETLIKNDDHWSGTRCNSVFLEVVGRNGNIKFRFTKPGCSVWIWCRLSEKSKEGSTDDLSHFAFDLTQWQNIKIINRNKTVSVLINNQKQFEDTYTKSIGEIVGTSITFHGNGAVRNYKLTDNSNNTLFEL